MTDAEHLDVQIIDYLDGALDDVTFEKAKRHLERCMECRRKVDSYHEVRALYREVSEEGPSTDVALDILSQSRKISSRGRTISLRRWWPAVAAISAAALVLVFFFFQHQFREKNNLADHTKCEDLRKEGERLVEAGDREGALEKYAMAVECNPKGPMVAHDYHQQGRLCLELGQMEEALEYFSKVINGYPSYEMRSEVMVTTATLLEKMADEPLDRETLKALESLGYVK